MECYFAKQGKLIFHEIYAIAARKVLPCQVGKASSVIKVLTYLVTRGIAAYLPSFVFKLSDSKTFHATIVAFLSPSNCFLRYDCSSRLGLSRDKRSVGLHGHETVNPSRSALYRLFTKSFAKEIAVEEERMKANAIAFRLYIEN